MQRHLSTGSATLAALMAAHRLPDAGAGHMQASASPDLARLLAAMLDHRVQMAWHRPARPEAHAPAE